MSPVAVTSDRLCHALLSDSTRAVWALGSRGHQHRAVVLLRTLCIVLARGHGPVSPEQTRGLWTTALAPCLSSDALPSAVSSAAVRVVALLAQHGAADAADAADAGDAGLSEAQAWLLTHVGPHALALLRQLGSMPRPTSGAAAGTSIATGGSGAAGADAGAAPPATVSPTAACALCVALLSTPLPPGGPSVAQSALYVGAVDAALALLLDEGCPSRSVVALTVLSTLVGVASTPAGAQFRPVVVEPLVAALKAMKRAGGPLRVDAFSLCCQFYQQIPELVTGPTVWCVGAALCVCVPRPRWWAPFVSHAVHTCVCTSALSCTACCLFGPRWACAGLAGGALPFCAQVARCGALWRTCCTFRAGAPSATHWRMGIP